MVEERTCDYTGEPIEPGTGIMYVRSDGSVLHFVDSKAEKNYFLGREPRDLEWTEAGRAARGARAAGSADPDSEAADDGTAAAETPDEGETADGAAEDEDDEQPSEGAAASDDDETDESTDGESDSDDEGSSA